MSRISIQELVATIEYPNELAYAGMPAIVAISEAAFFNGAGITIKVGDVYYTETRVLRNGAATFDISRYMQMAFIDKHLGYGAEQGANPSQLSQNVSVVVKLTALDGVQTTNALSFDVMVLYGYIGIGQTNGGGVRKRKWFINYPQTLDMYINKGSQINSSVKTAQGNSNTYIANNVQSESYVQASIRLSKPLSFDDTSTKGEVWSENTAYINGDSVAYGKTTYSLDIDRSTSGVYLRWLDHFGHWCYYLFRVTGRNYTTKAEESWQDGILRDSLKADNGVFIASGQTMQQMSHTERLSLGAKLVDAETFDYLLSLASSPIVEVLVNAEEYQADNSTTPLWERVNIVGGSYARTGAPLQDFVVSIARTAQKSQML